MAFRKWSSVAMNYRSPVMSSLLLEMIEFWTPNILTAQSCQQWHGRICCKDWKNLIKCADDGSNIRKALRNLRKTKRPVIMLSPVQLLMSRHTTALLPMAKSLLSPTTLPDTRANRRQWQIKQAALSDRKAHNLQSLQERKRIPVKPATLGQKHWG